MALAVCATAAVVCGIPASSRAPDVAVTRVRMTDTVIEPQATRLGINLGEQNFYDSGQMLRNLVGRNPGFEGMTYRSVVHCNRVQDGCTETMGGVRWPAGFWDGGSYEALVRLQPGATDVYVPATASGWIGQSLPSADGYRVEAVSGNAPMEPGEWVRLSKDFPDDPAAGWWTSLYGGARLSAERRDLSQKTLGKQALRVEAAMAGQSADVTSYFDSSTERSFVWLHGVYVLRFLAKPLAGNRSFHVDVGREGRAEFFSQQVALRSGWQDYEFRFVADDWAGAKAAAARLRFQVQGASVLLDDVSLEAVPNAAMQNPTAFRDAVVQTLRALHPGLMRLMAGEQLGASMHTLLEPRMARERAGYSVWKTREEDVAVGVPEFLELCRAVGAEPWIVVPLGIDAQDAELLAEYLAGDNRSPGGALRASEGQAAPWTTVFPRIHLELGNEAWNSIFHGESMEYAGAYGAQARQVWTAFRRRASAYSSEDRFDLVVNGQAGTQSLPESQDALALSASGVADTLAIAPYLMHTVDHGATDAELFDPLLAETEYFEMHGMLAEARRAAGGKRLAVYEVNLHATEGAASQAALDRLTPSLAGGIAVTDLMLRMKRDEGARDAMVFGLPQYEFRRNDGKQVRLWGTVVDMGPTMRRRPLFLAEAMVNGAMAGDMVRLTTSGADPVHSVARGNDGVELAAAHDLDFFGFRQRRDGHVHRVVVAYNLSRTATHTVQLERVARGTRIAWSRLWNADPGASNENVDEIKPQSGENLAENFLLPPCSITVLQWDE